MDNKYFNQQGLGKGFLAAIVCLLLLITALGVFYFSQTQTEPSRGYTVTGVVLGIVAVLLLLLDGFYAWRKRLGQEFLFGRLRTWLWMHVIVAILAFVTAGFHAGWHLDGGIGSWLMGFLILTFLSGLYGWWVYLRVPRKVNQTVGNLAILATQKQLQASERLYERLKLGFPVSERELAQIFDPKSMVEERPLSLEKLDSSIEKIKQKIAKQKSLKRQLRTWLYLHIPAAILVFVLLPIHIADQILVKDVFDLNLTQTFNTPAHYADPASCAECHQTQYNEWIGSMHAHAVASPVTELQNYLVVLKERELLASGQLKQPVVDDLCVKCHAPTGYLGNAKNHEDILISAQDREPASRFGVSCVSCHQIESVTALAGEAEFPYRNIRNIKIDNTAIMRGQNKRIVGNAAHQSRFSATISNPVLCASCHTVAVEDPKTHKAVLPLQDTYSEWLTGGKNFSWNDTHCMSCHNMPLDNIVAEVKKMQQQRLPLKQRLQRIKPLIQQNKLANKDTFSADPAQTYDTEISSGVRRFQHTFTGVDYHLEAQQPFTKSEDEFVKNSEIHSRTNKRMDNLLKISSAIKIKTASRNSVTVDVMNLATGHHLPAGFAFAREMWLEVAASPSRSGDNWVVLLGGDNQHALSATQALNKKEKGLKNFQAVLFDGTKGKETVLQNEATAVLKGKDAVKAGFKDREKFLLPAEIRRLTLRFKQRLNNPKRIRVRLRFRNYPIEFIEGLALRFDKLGDTQRAARSRALIKQLKIIEIAEDEVGL